MLECAVCQVRPSIGACAVCGKLLCDTCGAVCDECGAPSCSAHAHWSGNGRALCDTCYKGATRSRSREAFAEPKADKAPSAFTDSSPYSGGPRSSGSRMAGQRRDASESRVLTASARGATPVWVSSIFTGGLGWVLLIPLLPVLSKGNIFYEAQPLMSYCIMFLGLGTMVWAGTGMFNHAPKPERLLCLVGLSLGLTAAIAAFLVRAPVTP